MKKLKWLKALNGYYYTEPNEDGFIEYTIEVTTNLEGIKKYAPTKNLKNGDYIYLNGWSYLTLKTAKKDVENDYKK